MSKKVIIIIAISISIVAVVLWFLIQSHFAGLSGIGLFPPD